MRTTVYARLFDRLADLIPSLQSARAGAVFCAPPRIPDDMAVYCHIAAVEGDMRLIELAEVLEMTLEEVKTSEPDSDLSNKGSSAWVSIKVPLTLTCITCCQTSGFC